MNLIFILLNSNLVLAVGMKNIGGHRLFDFGSFPNDPVMYKRKRAFWAVKNSGFQPVIYE